MAIVESWIPPTREHWLLLNFYFRVVYTGLGIYSFFSGWYGMGKTSVTSRLNIPGRVAWMAMETPGFVTLLYTVSTLSKEHGIDDLPWQNRVLAGLFVIHYSYRAVIFPLIQPSMSPIHASVALMAAGFQVLNGSCIGGWLGAYGPTTQQAWDETVTLAQFAAGIAIFYVGLSGNFFHDEELREIRRNEKRRQEKDAQAVSVEKHYNVPQAGLFRYVLYPHYLCEWLEWFGFWMATGFACAPAFTFLLNEVAAMLPRAILGRRWYIEKFGADKIGARKAVIPGLI